jgi:hypothetical protein
MNKYIGVICAILLSVALQAQQLPADNATLNYRIVGFSVPQNTSATSCVFQIAKGNQPDEAAFVKAVFIKHKTDKTTDIEELPQWGKAYTWRVVYADKAGKEIGNSGLHHFTTGNLPYTDTTKNGLVIVKQATDHKDLLVLVDRALVMYDMKGSPVWYMPDIPEIKKRDFNIRDFKPTADGTFTLLNNDEAIEIDYNGKIVWAAPNDGKVSGKKIEGYHHEFTKLANGHYMVAGAEIVKMQVPAPHDDYFAEGDKQISKDAGGNYFAEFTCGTLIEYDAAGNVVWFWKAAEHMNSADFFVPKNKLTKPFDCNPYLNGFDFDEANKVIYISYKNINRVMKIAYPGGEVLNTYGANGSQNLFYGQHACRVNPRTNELYLYNNNHSDYLPLAESQFDAEGYLTSHIVKYKQPPGRNNSLINNWDVGLRLIQDKKAFQLSTRGGSISILDDDCVLVSAGTLNLILLIDKQKQKIWEAVPYTTENNQRVPLIPYRTSYMHKKDLDKFVFPKALVVD